jgi:hypothetical protein
MAQDGGVEMLIDLLGNNHESVQRQVRRKEREETHPVVKRIPIPVV